MFRLDFPFALVFLLVIPVIIYIKLKKRTGVGIRFSSITKFMDVSLSFKQRFIHLPLACRILSLIMLIFAIARPQQGMEVVKNINKGVAMEMVVDRSGSMGLLKDFGEESFNRLDIVKQVFKEFIMGNDSDLEGRPSDLIGMISFARYADTLCPFTLSHDILFGFLRNLNIVKVQSEDGTSIGDAIALASARLKTLEDNIYNSDESNKYEIKSKIIILLTDGEDTGIGKRTPLEAGLLAKEWGIKIYIIGIGGDGWYYIQEDIFGVRKAPARSNFNTSVLNKIASETGGIFRKADDLNSLRDVYKEIDALEKSEIQSVQYLDYRELFPGFILFGLFFLCLEFIFTRTVFRRIP